MVPFIALLPPLSWRSLVFCCSSQLPPAVVAAEGRGNVVAQIARQAAASSSLSAAVGQVVCYLRRCPPSAGFIISLAILGLLFQPRHVGPRAHQLQRRGAPQQDMLHQAELIFYTVEFNVTIIAILLAALALIGFFFFYIPFWICRGAGEGKLVVGSKTKNFLDSQNNSQFTLLRLLDLIIHMFCSSSFHCLDHILENKWMVGVHRIWWIIRCSRRIQSCGRERIMAFQETSEILFYVTSCAIILLVSNW